MSLLSLVNAGNIAFIVSLIAVFSVKNIFGKGIIILISSLLIKFRSGFDAENVFFLIALTLGAVLGEKLPFKKTINMIVAFLISFTALNAYLYLS